MRTRSLITAGLLATLLSATACSDGEPEAEPTPKMPTTSSTTSEPEPEPEPWEVKSRAGVKAFLQRYVQVFSDAARTGDTSEYRSLGPNCDGCNQIADQIDEVYQAGGRIESGPYRFAGWSIDENGLHGSAACVVTYATGKTTWIRTKGASPETYPAGQTDQLVTLQWQDDAWVIIGLENLAQ